MTPAEIERYRALRQAQRGGLSFRDFVLTRAPELGRDVPKHLRRLYRVIEESRWRPIRVKLSQPPRTGKSTTFRLGSAWRMLRDPACLNFYVPGGDGLAVDFSYKTRRLARAVGVPLADDRANVHHWSTSFDGGLKAVSLFGDLVGRGCNGGIIFCDDMLRGREDAESKLKRDKIWDTFRDDVMSRLERGGGLIVCNTRWHEDDVHGRLAKDPLGEAWEDIVIPAVVDPDGYATDDITNECIPVWPEAGFDLDWARKAKARGLYGFWSLYNQAPRPRGGSFFNEPARFDLSTFSYDGWRLVLVLDPAATANTASDYSAWGVLAMRGAGESTQGRVLVRFRKQEPLPVVIRRIRQLRERFPLPLWVEGVGGFAALPSMIRAIDPTIPVNPIPAKLMRGGKMERATPLAAAWNDPSGRFAVPLGDDWDEYIDEFRDFTGIDDAHDDQVDWTAHAWNIGYRGANAPDVGLSTPIYGGGNA